MELEGREIFSSSRHPGFCCDFRKTFGPTDLTRACVTLCVLGGYLVSSGMEPRPFGLESDALTARTLRNTYIAFIQSILKYGVQVYQVVFAKNLDKLERVQLSVVSHHWSPQ
ncbi:hypothetical protein TNCV_953841 [Trichonephila clavipes]|nr:hypothetical protein TNCV_953841 [Trichonephila clavipes]